MSSLFIDRRNVTITLDGGALVFRENGERIGTVPTAPLDRVFVRGGVTVDTSVLLRLGEAGIGVVILDGRKDAVRMFLPPVHNDAVRRLAQYVLSTDSDFCREATLGIVREKLQASRDALAAFRLAYGLHDAGYERMEAMITSALGRLDVMNSVDSIRGVEGRAATWYFTALGRLLPADLEFSGRNRRPPRDPVNAALSLAYTLLVSEAGLALHGAGLDPMVGFLHKLDFGRPSLACDLMEPVRPLVDRFVIDLFRQKTLLAEDFSTTEKGCFMSKTARSRFYPAYEAAGAEWRGRLERHALRMAGGLVEAFRKRHPGAACHEQAAVLQTDSRTPGRSIHETVLEDESP